MLQTKEAVRNFSLKVKRDKQSHSLSQIFPFLE
jgi:hypothetical protein